MRHGVLTAMIEACSMDGQTPEGEDPTVIYHTSQPDMTAAMVAERHCQFLAEAQQARQLAHLDRGGTRGIATSRFVMAMRNAVARWTNRDRSWRGLWWAERLSMSSKS